LNLRPHPAIRHCPVCGIAMLASKSREDLPHFDKFECLTCRSVISEAKPAGGDDQQF
jgi:C4-type Zn-finger protein